MSHPLRVRGLKQVVAAIQSLTPESHPLRVRGLKLDNEAKRKKLNPVASFTGAWIETVDKPLPATFCTSHPLRVRGLKPLKVLTPSYYQSRILYGCVD